MNSPQPLELAEDGSLRCPVPFPTHPVHFLIYLDEPALIIGTSENLRDDLDGDAKHPDAQGVQVRLRRHLERAGRAMLSWDQPVPHGPGLSPVHSISVRRDVHATPVEIHRVLRVVRDDND